MEKRSDIVHLSTWRTMKALHTCEREIEIEIDISCDVILYTMLSIRDCKRNKKKLHFVYNNTDKWYVNELFFFQ